MKTRKNTEWENTNRDIDPQQYVKQWVFKFKLLEYVPPPPLKKSDE